MTTPLSRARSLLWATLPHQDFDMRLFERAIQAVATERDRQQELLRLGCIKFNCATWSVPDVSKLTILVEEVGEVATEIHEASRDTAAYRRRLRKELVQVAAVSVAWVEALDDEQFRHKVSVRLKNKE